jgi:hypothetical protein
MLTARKLSASLPLALLPRSPKRTQSKPRKNDGATKSRSESAASDLAGVKLSVLLHGGSSKTDRHNKKDESGNFEPKLMQHPPKSARGAADSTHHSVKRTAPACLIARHPSHYSSLSPCRNFGHGLDFNSLQALQ